MPLYDSQVSWLANQAMNYLVGGEIPQRMGTAHPNIVPYQAFATGDGELMLAVGNEEQFAACAVVIGQPDLIEDPRFASNALRLEHREILIERMSRALHARTTDEWLGAFREAGVPAGPVNDLSQVFADPHVAERGLVAEVDHGAAGRIPTVVNPVRFSGQRQRAELAPPMLGEHTDEILAEELGYSQHKISALRAAGAI